RRGIAAMRHARIKARRARVRVWERGRRHPALLVPASRNWGFDRGGAIDRYYIEDFLQRHAGDEHDVGDIHGRCLEIGRDDYTSRFGGAVKSGGEDGVQRLDVLDINPSNEKATIIGDLADPETLPADTFDCVICTQVLMLIYDIRAALAN